MVSPSIHVTRVYHDGSFLSPHAAASLISRARVVFTVGGPWFTNRRVISWLIGLVNEFKQSNAVHAPSTWPKQSQFMKTKNNLLISAAANCPGWIRLDARAVERRFKD
jgi:hypothetical protein